MKRNLFMVFIVMLLAFLPVVTIESEARGPAWKQTDDSTVDDSTKSNGPGNAGNNSRHNRTEEVVEIETPQEEPVQETETEEVIEIPEEKFEEPIVLDEPAQNDEQLVTYIVQSGDTLWLIANRFGVSVQQIKDTNQLTSDVIFVGQVLIIPVYSPIIDEPKEENQIDDFLVLGYYTKYWTNDLTSYQSLGNYHSSINSIAVTTYQVNELGSIEVIDAPEARELAKQHNIKTYATIQNHFQPELTHTILSNAELRQKTIENIYHVVTEKGYDGVNIDFENMYASDRALFNQFIKEASEFFQPRGYDFIVSVTAKTADHPTWAWSGTFDYEFLGQYAKLQLMSYDNAGIWSLPGATSGVDWVENVLKYATSIVPSEQLLIGLPAYGYEWYSSTGEGIRALSLKQIDTILASSNATVQFDTKTQSPYFYYMDEASKERVVWFENESSISAKMELVQKYNLGGISMWRMGLENDMFWNTVDSFLK
ncbi:glycosyl hydrolase family 18 protein [Bacillus sp. FJAT-45350]|uniref:glycosyl hydrolase family 18 protein n=1 Tax=Bacillus sp. FJAT-45350 TaxID=2011014 RepID=UPI000BB7EE99|nr:glycosyl hydrolase family 18 protein [Bacillus sp. FJAT-45350]